MSSNLIDKIYSILTKRRYNRGRPHLPEDLRQCIDIFVKKSDPIRFVGFWGIGHKSSPSEPEERSCEFLNALNEEVKKIYPPGIKFLFLLADQHALHNGYVSETILSYMEGMKALFEKFGFEYVYLHDLWNKNGITFEKIDENLKVKSPDWWSRVEHASLIEHNAKTRNKTHLPREGAQRYFVMRDLEKRMLVQEYDGSVFHAFSDPKLKSVLPDMPTLYFYAREGWSNAPWFVD